MAIWSSYNRASNALGWCLCEECSGNGQLLKTDEHTEEMMFGGGICPSCKGTGLNKSHEEVLSDLEKALKT